MTPNKLTPEQRARIEFENAIADAFQRGKQEGRGEVLQTLLAIVDSKPNTPGLDKEIREARRKLKEWGV